MKTHRIKNKTVHVVAWLYNGGGGFNWFFTSTNADKAFAAERANVIEFKADKWRACRFDYHPKARTHQGVTVEIDNQLDALCKRAARRMG
jgi:hypothetical protein